MVKRSRPHVDETAVLQRLRMCRTAMVELSAGSAPRSLRRAAADQMIHNIDELIWVLTGERPRFGP